MVGLLLILLNVSYSQLPDSNQEIILKDFIPSGSIEALIDDYNETYYLIQLDL